MTDLLLFFQIVGEKAGDRAADFLHSDNIATYMLCLTFAVAGLLLGYAIAGDLL